LALNENPIEKEEPIMKHWIGKREAERLNIELASIDSKLEALNEKVNGFKKFYDDVEENRKLVHRKLWIEEVIQRGYYHK